MLGFRRPTPALVISLTALFFALGGTAFALGSKTAPQPRCQTGAARGFAVLDPSSVDLSGLPASYTSPAGLFTYTWNCGGGQIRVKKDHSHDGVDILFTGNPAKLAIVQSFANGVPNAGSVSRQDDGSFLVTMGGSNTNVPGPWQFQWNVPFMIVLF
jgi:hypothetical protein